MKSQPKRVSLWGPKGPMREPADVVEEADVCLDRLKELKPIAVDSVPSIRNSFADYGRSYYALAALSRRKILPDKARGEAMSRLFSLRALLEQRMLESLKCSASSADILGYAARSTFFGRSIKQGVSIRYPLAVCVPTKLCGGRCYAHDGRDRDLQRVFRGVLNWYLGDYYQRRRRGKARCYGVTI